MAAHTNRWLLCRKNMFIPQLFKNYRISTSNCINSIRLFATSSRCCDEKSGDGKNNSFGDKKENSSGDTKMDSSRDKKKDSSRDTKKDSSGDTKKDSSKDTKKDSSGDTKMDSSRDKKKDSSGDTKKDSQGKNNQGKGKNEGYNNFKRQEVYNKWFSDSGSRSDRPGTPRNFTPVKGKTEEPEVHASGQMHLENMERHWEAEFFTNPPLGLFTKEDVDFSEKRTKLAQEDRTIWDELYEEDMRIHDKVCVQNGFDEMIELTKEGKLWHFPIDNDQGHEENKVPFNRHVFLDHLLEEFPNKGPIRHFMHLVVTGLSKNPHLTVKQKEEHIQWYKSYFKANENVMEKALRETGQIGEKPDTTDQKDG